jgi:Rhodopirellula transposase DDE domain
MAEITLEFFEGNPRQAERELGWGRATTEKGLRELATGIECVDNYSARGNKPMEETLPHLAQDICGLVDPPSQVDPKFQTPFAYTRITAKAVRQALIEVKGYGDDELPNEKTIGNILNRLGYRLRRVQKTKPQKKIPETTAIFANVRETNRAADENEKSLRISVDTKAKVKIGDVSRGGVSRGQTAVQALDHEMKVDQKLVPVGIVEPTHDALTICFSTSNETSDVIVDCLEQWWEDNQGGHATIEELVIDLDGGPHVHSHRTQFIKRIVEFADQTDLSVRLVYYPPYHSKYNPIERCWGVLENHWNGALLNSVEAAIEWASTLTWNGVKPVVHLLNKTYKKGVKLTKKAMKAYAERLQRSETLPKWDVSIEPKFG